MKVKILDTFCCQKLSNQITIAYCDRFEFLKFDEIYDGCYPCRSYDNEDHEPIEVEVLDLFEFDEVKYVCFEVNYDGHKVRYWTHEFDSMGQLVFVRNHDSEFLIPEEKGCESDIMNAYFDSQLDDRLL